MFGKLISLFAGSPASSDAGKILDAKQHDEVFHRAVGRLSPCIQLLGRESGGSRWERREILTAIAELQAVIDYNPANWGAFWFRGKGYQVLGNHECAHREFKKSFELEKENPDVAREYAVACLELGYGEEGVFAARHAAGLRSDDAGLRANLALALLLAARAEEAKAEIGASLAFEPEDRISKSVEKVIDEVLSGKRKQPRFMAELDKPAARTAP